MAGSEDTSVEEAESADAGTDMMGFNRGIGVCIRDEGWRSEGPVEDSADPRFWADERSTRVRSAAVTDEALEGRFLNVNFCLGAWVRTAISSLCLNELIACSPDPNQNGLLLSKSSFYLPENRSAVRRQ